MRDAHAEGTAVGTRLFWKAGDMRQAEDATGSASGKHLGVYAPPFTADYPTLPCAADPELFQPDGYNDANKDQIAAAKAVCRGCPARAACRAWAVAAAEPYGIWGATTPMERWELRKRAGLPAARGNRRGLFDQQGRRVS